jgi:hypothetical protein
VHVGTLGHSRLFKQVYLNLNCTGIAFEEEGTYPGFCSVGFKGCHDGCWFQNVVYNKGSLAEPSYASDQTVMVRMMWSYFEIRNDPSESERKEMEFLRDATVRPVTDFARDIRVNKPPVSVGC